MDERKAIDVPGAIDGGASLSAGGSLGAWRRCRWLTTPEH
jgi:hypothetical protein